MPRSPQPLASLGNQQLEFNHRMALLGLETTGTNSAAEYEFLRRSLDLNRYQTDAGTPSLLQIITGISPGYLGGTQDFRGACIT